tara:strand:+ start:650 stop:958 length:309 start_codon:yes stop_codon:yes gene_type:complete
LSFVVEVGRIFIKKQIDMKAATRKFETTYTRTNDIVSLLDNRFDTEMESWTRNDLMKEYKKLSSQLTKLSAKISEDEFELLESDLCMDYETFQESWDNTYTL